ncbi:MAG: hypothetical protein ABWY37_07785 [Microbacterium pygmaeum]
MTIRRVILWLTAAIGAFVGVWAAGFPQSFYDSFPGFGFVWISVDGPFNEHLIRDVGSLYLALAAASAAATFSRTPDAGRVVGVAWAVFGIPHFAYHAAHFAHMAPADVIGNVVSLGASLLLGIVLILPGPRSMSSQPESQEKERVR